MAIQLTISNAPDLIETAFNDITLSLKYYNTTIPSKKIDTLYAEIYTITNRNILTYGNGKGGAAFLARLINDSDANGTATFILNETLTTAINGYVEPSTVLLQRDTTNYVGYYIKYGYVKYNSTNDMSYKKIGETDIKWALRAVLQDNEYLPVIDYFNAITYLTHIPDNIEIHQNENTYLSFVLPVVPNQQSKGLLVKADLYFNDNSTSLNTTVGEYKIGKGGIYLVNAKPSLIAPTAYQTLDSFDIWIEYDTVSNSAEVVDDAETVYTSTATYTATCPSGYTGIPVTSEVTAYSTNSALEAKKQATAQARENSEASLTCSILYTGTKTATVTCQNGYYTSSGGTATATATSYDSQSDADAQAYVQALAEAQASLQCSVITNTYTSTKSYTASCPSGQYGHDVTRTATATSYTTQADADDKALAQATSAATADLQCSTTQTTYNSTQSYTARCGEGYKGGSATRTAYAESVISQADADERASNQAQVLAQNALNCRWAGPGPEPGTEGG